MKTKTHTLLMAAITAAAIVVIFHTVASAAPVLAETIRSSSVYIANNIMGDILLTAVAIILTISIIAGRDARIMREKNRALRAQIRALRTQNENLRAHYKSADTLMRYYKVRAKSAHE